MAPLSPLNGSRPVSRINSYNRTWSNPASAPSASQEEPIDWPPSPVKPVAPSKLLSAHERRMAAIQEALSQPLEEQGRAFVSTSTSNKRTMPFDDDAGPVKKRAMPWEIDHSQLKGGKTRQARGSAKTTQPTGPVLNVKQSVLLSAEQKEILKLVQDGKSVFYTGSAGTGKSVLLREIISTLRRKFVKTQDAVAITASTGIAACNIGGVTLHSFAGIGLGHESSNELVSKIKKNKKASGRWLRTQVLIIDEISMVDGDLFDKLSEIGSAMRKRPTPFGGIQIVVTGDFFQLPPVMKGGQPKFAFEAEYWNKCIDRTFNLTKVFRQKDQEFVDMLNEMRFGRLSQKSIAKFKALSRPVHYEDGMEPTELFPHRDDVDRSNRTRMTALGTESRTYYASDGGTITNPQQREKVLGNLMCSTQLHLKIDAQVMLIKNMPEESLVNGSIGRVVAFVSPAAHKAGIANAGADEYEEDGKKKAKPADQNEVLWPLVHFSIPGSKVPKEMLVEPETWKVESNGEVQASRTQLPLILSWAMSIHKSQGQTLDRVKVDLGRAFEMGQAYVALSRATSLEGLQILRFDPSKVRAHPKVAAWSQTLESINS